jgi:hypothetical protein
MAQLHSALARLAAGSVSDGSSVGDLEDFRDFLRLFTDRESVADSDMDPFQLIYVSSEGHVDLADASSIATSQVAGMTTSEAASGGFVSWRAFGVIEQVNWGLTPNSPYFLSTNAGEILTAPVDATGNSDIMIGQSLSEDELFLDPSQIVVL